MVKIWNQASTESSISTAISRKVRQSSVLSAKQPAFRSLCFAVGNEDVAEAPDGLDVARLGRIVLDQLAQARDLHVDGAVEDVVFAAARQFHQLVARQRLARMFDQHLEQGEFAGGERGDGAVAGQFAGAEVDA